MAMMGGGFGPQMMRSLRRDGSVTKERLTPGTVRRIVRYARPFSRHIAAFLALVVVGSVIVIANPLLMKAIIDDGITPKRSGESSSPSRWSSRAWRSPTRRSPWHSAGSPRGSARA